MSIKEENVLVLQYGIFNLSYPEIVKLKVDALPDTIVSVDLEKGTWRPFGHELCPTCKGELHINYTILDCDHPRRYYGVIGLFDGSNIPDIINKMLIYAIDARDDIPI